MIRLDYNAKLIIDPLPFLLAIVLMILAYNTPKFNAVNPSSSNESYDTSLITSRPLTDSVAPAHDSYSSVETAISKKSTPSSDYDNYSSYKGHNDDAGYNSEDADWIREQGLSPSEVRAAEMACGEACQ